MAKKNPYQLISIIITIKVFILYILKTDFCVKVVETRPLIIFYIISASSACDIVSNQETGLCCLIILIII